MKEKEILRGDILERQDFDFDLELVLSKECVINEKENKVNLNKHGDYNFNYIRFFGILTLKREEAFEDEIEIIFTNCFFHTIKIENEDLINVSFRFNSCVTGAAEISNKNITQITFHNTLGNFQIKNVPIINIYYVEYLIALRDWYFFNGIKVIHNFSGEPLSILNSLLYYPAYFNISDAKSIKAFGNEITNQSRNSIIKRGNKNIYLHRSLGYMLLLQDHDKAKLNINLRVHNSPANQTKEISVSNLILKDFLLSGIYEGKISIQDSKIEAINLIRFYPKSNFILHNVSSISDKGAFKIYDSNLDNTWFNSVSLKSYALDFSRSSFVNTKFSSTVFPSVKDLTLVYLKKKDNRSTFANKEMKDKSFYRNKYDLFLELMKALDKRGNVHEAQKMKAVAYYFLYKVYDSNIFKADFWNNKFVLFLNKTTNFYGVSVKKSFFSIGAMLIVFHGLNIVSFRSVEIGWSSFEDFTTIMSNTKRYLFVIANPTHRVSSLGPIEEITDLTYLISFLSRICFGYLYYQFIVAFRRFGK